MAASKKTKEKLESEKYKKIRSDLLDQLEINGTTGEYYTDLVDDYMDMWATKCLLVDDIQKRGVTIPYNNGGGQKGRKKNDSIETRININKQMLALLEKLRIKPARMEGEASDTEEL